MSFCTKNLKIYLKIIIFPQEFFFLSRSFLNQIISDIVQDRVVWSYSHVICSLSIISISVFLRFLPQIPFLIKIGDNFCWKYGFRSELFQTYFSINLSRWYSIYLPVWCHFEQLSYRPWYHWQSGYVCSSLCWRWDRVRNPSNGYCSSCNKSPWS